MKNLKQILVIYLTLIPFVLAIAQGPQIEFTGTANGRENPNFSSGEIRGLVPKGTKAEINQVRQTKRGFALRIKITDLSNISEKYINSKRVLKIGDEVWVYYRNKHPWIKLKDPDGVPTKNPLDALYAEAKKSGHSTTTLPSEDEFPPLVDSSAESVIHETIGKIEKANEELNIAESKKKSQCLGECGSPIAQVALALKALNEKVRGEQLTSFDECSGENGIKATYVNDITSQGLKLAACNRNRKMSLALADFINQNMSPCVQQAMSSLGIGNEISKIHIKHAGIRGDENHSTKSLHAVLRAIDINELEVELNDSSNVKFNVVAGWSGILARKKGKALTTAQKQSVEFYSQFRRCWANKLVEQNQCQNKGALKMRGSVGWEDPDHRNHLHLSLPYCPANNGFYGS